MKFSVVIPVYNCENILHISVESILNQTYSDLELILINDGSKDNSLNVCKKYADIDKRVKVLSQNNLGSGSARNNGLKNSHGDYVVFCDADDYYELNALENFYKSIIKTNADLIISNYSEIKINKDNEKIILKKPSIDIVMVDGKANCRLKYFELYKNNLNKAPWAKAFKLALIKKYDICFEDIRRCQDIVFNVRFADKINSISIINSYTYNYTTPNGEIYLSKFPKDMYMILNKVNDVIVSYLKKWNLYNRKQEIYLNSELLYSAAICIRLNYKNIWKFTRQQQKKYYINIIENEGIQKAIHGQVIGILNNLFKVIFKSKKIFLIELMCKGIYQYKRLRDMV